jgi:predicted Zn finger-like uncharacterized protein
MIILCDNCKAKYRLSEDKIAGKGARVKCRKCSDYIIVMKPEYEHLKREFIDGIRADELKRAAEEKEETREVDEAEQEVEPPVEPPVPREDEREEEERELFAGESAERHRKKKRRRKKKREKCSPEKAQRKILPA